MKTKTEVSYTLEGFKQYTTNNGGFIFSDGTLNNLHLLTKAYDFIQLWEVPNSETIKQEILQCFNPTSEDYEVNGNLSLYMQQYHGEIELKTYEEMREQYRWSDSDLWNEDIYNLFNRISPDGFYFGSSEGDGACIGWFKFEEDEADK